MTAKTRAGSQGYLNPACPSDPPCSIRPRASPRRFDSVAPRRSPHRSVKSLRPRHFASELRADLGVLPQTFVPITPPILDQTARIHQQRSARVSPEVSDNLRVGCRPSFRALLRSATTRRRRLALSPNMGGVVTACRSCMRGVMATNWPRLETTGSLQGACTGRPYFNNTCVASTHPFGGIAPNVAGACVHRWLKHGFVRAELMPLGPSLGSFAHESRVWTTTRWVRLSSSAQVFGDVDRRSGSVGFVCPVARALHDCHYGSVGFVRAVFSVAIRRDPGAIGRGIDYAWYDAFAGVTDCGVQVTSIVHSHMLGGLTARQDAFYVRSTMLSSMCLGPGHDRPLLILTTGLSKSLNLN